MLTRIDHVMICVRDLEQGIDAYTRLGFNVDPGGGRPGKRTQNAIALHEEDYLELVSVRDRQEYLAVAPGGGLMEFLSRGGGSARGVSRSPPSSASVGRPSAGGGARTPRGADLQ